MRVLFLCHFFPPTHTSGAENYTFNLAQALVKQGHQVQVLCAGTWDSGERYWNGYTDETYAEIQVRRLHICWHKAPDPNRYLYDNPVTAAHLRDWLAELRPDVVHITSCYTLSASVIQVCKDAGLPVVLTLVDFWFLCPSLHLLRSDGALCDGQTTPWQCLRCLMAGAKAYRWPARLLPEAAIEPVLSAASRNAILNRQRGLRGLALNMAERKQVMSRQLQQVDVLLAPSRFLAETHAAVIDGLPLRVQEYGHDLSWLADYSAERTSGGPVRFCYMGQITHDKGVHVLVEAFLRLDPTSCAQLDIWGGLNDSVYVAHIRQLCAHSGNIQLRGRFPRSQLAAVLAEADVVVAPSIWYENNPLVIQEAFAARIPVIASSLGGMAEFVTHELNGLLFKPSDADDLARQMERIVIEPELLERLRVGIPTVKTIEQETTQLMQLYNYWCREKVPQEGGMFYAKTELSVALAS